jgi:WD40 repeat protein
VTGIVFSADGRKLVSAGDDEALTVWDSQSGEKLASRALDDRDPMYTRWSKGVTTRHHQWRATPEAIVALDGWAGFAVAPPPQVFAAEVRDGDIAIVRRVTGEVVAWFPASEPVAAHPNGRIWAGACCHFVLEGSA